MTLRSRHRIRNSRPGGLRTSILPQYWISTSERGRNILFLWKIEGQSGVRTRDPRFSKHAGSFTHCTRAPTLSDQQGLFLSENYVNIYTMDIWILSNSSGFPGGPFRGESPPPPKTGHSPQKNCLRRSQSNSSPPPQSLLIPPNWKG